MNKLLFAALLLTVTLQASTLESRYSSADASFDDDNVGTLGE